MNVKHAVIIGDEELQTDTVILRDMADSTQVRVLRHDLVRLFEESPYEGVELEMAGE